MKIYLSEKDKQELLILSRKTLENYFNNVFLDYNLDSKFLNSHLGAFVSFYENEKLRGCIGKIKSDIELYKLIKYLTIETLKDDRFEKLKKEDLQNIKIEISILTPLKKINDVNDIILGKHGIFLMNGYRNGTFLPKVAIETNWTITEFLGHCAQDKMDLNWNDWKTSDIFIFETETINEE
jgi:AmmeMemoRadiSam system protein A